MLTIRLIADPTGFDALALPVRPVEATAPDRGRSTGETDRDEGPLAELPPTALALPEDLLAEATALLPLVEQTGSAGTTHLSVRALRQPSRLLLVGVGAADEAGWRAAGAAIARTTRETSITIAMPADVTPEAVRGLAEGLWLASYRFRLAQATEPAGLTEVLVAVADPAAHEPALELARVTARTTRFARDLINTPSSTKSPQWLADQIVAAAAEHPGLTVSIREPEQLAAEGFGGILAVGNGSATGPRLVELSWHPAGASTHVVLVGKGITFDTGGISIKPREAMKLMRKDMAGAAAIVAATLGAAELRLPVRITALAPLAENMVSGSAFRPGDVIRHYGGLTSETTNSDAEGRLVLADALAYAVERLAPDLLIDIATLTGANAVALGKRHAALYSENDELAEALIGAGRTAGELAWRMPLTNDYVEYLGSDIADLYSAPASGAGSVTAALYLREFTGPLRDRWVHVDMSAPSWAEGNDGPVVKGATGYGVRTLLRWLGDLG
ncbi:leucyl aminopeptidase family protein [Micromonospora sp. NBC_01796]|uniref:leucyl aminopeptidase family protein n=1 Tax=Micromonospora sp. NBC_01796 TaxID=2975987 RepID=UPI002DD8F3C9|nr:leucyl aminopeptidase family protein [Micromonospora sp. NBC_01796]WSA89108.1 leucyl aminopeptidase family protein [Micromonospora sp. NBC_01796]